MSSLKKAQISIGLPVFNGEKFINQCIDSLLSQTFQEFELIISDNASTDLTSDICKEYASKDKRIKYIRHQKNNGSAWNLNFVLNEAKFEYFMWAAHDDLWESTFIEKNITVLEKNKNFVGSISEVEFYEMSKEHKAILIDITLGKAGKFQYTHSILGTYEERIDFLFKFGQPSCIYAIYRTDKLQKSVPKKPFANWDYAVIGAVLKFGELYVIDEILMLRYGGRGYGKISSISYIKNLQNQNVSIFKIIFYYVPFTIWCAKHFGPKIFMKRFGWVIRINYRIERHILLEAIELLRLKCKLKK